MARPGVDMGRTLRLGDPGVSAAADAYYDQLMDEEDERREAEEREENNKDENKKGKYEEDHTGNA